MLKKILIELKHRIWDYFDNATVHGVRYISQPKRHITERLFWATTCLLCCYGTYLLLNASWYNFMHNSISFNMDTSYLKWNTTFPALSVCEEESQNKVEEIATKMFGEDRDLTYDFLIVDSAYFSGRCSSCEFECGNSINCSDDFRELADQIRSPCDKMMKDCSWNSVPFECCDYFIKLETEMGPCFTINSIQTNNTNKQLDLTSNRKKGPGILKFNFVEYAAKVYIHSPEDVPFVNSPVEERPKFNWEGNFLIQFLVTEINNDKNLREVSINQRQCRFPDENFLTMYKYYSYSACIVECRAIEMAAVCNCTHHFMPKLQDIPVCGVSGLVCISEQQTKLRAIRRPEDEEGQNILCNCLTSCTEPEFKIIKAVTESRDTSNITDEMIKKIGIEVTIKMESLPTQRFKRNVVRTRLDLVVSMGGTAGLFLGASLLSSMELLFYLLIRRRSKSKPVDKEIVADAEEINESKKLSKLRNITVPKLLNSNDKSIYRLPLIDVKSGKNLPIHYILRKAGFIYPYESQNKLY